MAQNQPNVPQNPQLAQVNVQSFMAKYKSKRECYNFLTVQVEVYLPAYETVTIYFLKDLISGKKKRKCHHSQGASRSDRSPFLNAFPLQTSRPAMCGRSACPTTRGCRSRTCRKSS